MKYLASFSAAVALCLSANSAFAGCTSKYDYSTGNNYQICDNGGQTTIRGNNLMTGSTWSQTQNSNGSYFGQDSGGNYYNGNNKTGYYNNMGTGKTCYGTGAFRSCY